MIRYDLLVREAERRGYRDRGPVQRRAMEAAITATKKSHDPGTIRRRFPLPTSRAYYAENGAEYPRGAGARQLHSSGDAAEARALIAELRGKDNTFGKAARERSTDERTKSHSGELGISSVYLRSARAVVLTPQKLIDAAYALKASATSARRRSRSTASSES